MTIAPDLTPPSIDDARRHIDRVRSVDLAAASVDDVVEMLRPLLKGFRVKVPIWQPGFELFRGTTRFTRPPPSIEEFWHPPAASCPLGRANRAGTPMLYCSADIAPLFFELHATAGTRLAIIKYETTGPMVANRVGYTPDTFARLKSNRSVPDYGAMDIDAYSDVEKLVNDFLADVFCQEVPPDENWRYCISAAVADVLLGASATPINGLLYPTVPMWGNVDNLAIRSDFARANIRPVHAHFVKVSKVALPEMSFDVLDEARNFDSDGSIQWLGHQGQWKLRNQGDILTFLAVRGSYFEARDSNGVIIDPE